MRGRFSLRRVSTAGSARLYHVSGRVQKRQVACDRKHVGCGCGCAAHQAATAAQQAHTTCMAYGWARLPYSGEVARFKDLCTHLTACLRIPRIARTCLASLSCLALGAHRCCSPRRCHRPPPEPRPPLPKHRRSIAPTALNQSKSMPLVSGSWKARRTVSAPTTVPKKANCGAGPPAIAERIGKQKRERRASPQPMALPRDMPRER